MLCFPKLQPFSELWDTVVVCSCKHFVVLREYGLVWTTTVLFLGAVVDWSWPKVGWNCRGEAQTQSSRHTECLIAMEIWNWMFSSFDHKSLSWQICSHILSYVFITPTLRSYFFKASGRHHPIGPRIERKLQMVLRLGSDLWVWKTPTLGANQWYGLSTRGTFKTWFWMPATYEAPSLVFNTIQVSPSTPKKQSFQYVN